MSEKVWCRLDWAYGYQGQYYGPGTAVLVPTGLARAMMLPVVSAPVEAKIEKADPKGKDK